MNEKRIGQKSRRANHNVKRLVPDGDVKSITLKTGQFYARCLAAEPSRYLGSPVQRATIRSAGP
ncbi:hypothetical protein [Dentiradicibacter hellwigii]|uniref:Uncharacterized protein n=1 Tax=Dentiradicibacter hellwigii TaxID=3149053 RepID=A0ABV4UGJ2_9RHOO